MPEARIFTQLRIGLIGAARVAPYALIAPAREIGRAAVVAVAARDGARAAAFAAGHGIPKVHESYAALIADPDVDLIYIATPPAQHAGLAHLAIATGKHVLIEKPFALDAPEAAAIVDHATLCGVRAFEAMHAPHHALFTAIRDILVSGRIGEIRRASAHFSTMIAEGADEFRWAAGQGGGSLMDLGIYPLAFCRRLLGENFRVSALSAGFRRGVDSHMMAELRFGAIEARISSSMIEPSEAWLEIGGEEGTLLARNPVAPSLGNRLVHRTRDCIRDEEIGGPSSWTAQLGAIASTLLDGAPFPVSLDDPVRSMRAIDLIRAHPDWQSSVSERDAPK